MSDERRLRCGSCGRTRPEEETALVRGRSRGDYRRAGRSIWRRICRDCVQARVDYARQAQADNMNAPLDTNQFSYSTGARILGIDIEGIRRR